MKLRRRVRFLVGILFGLFIVGFCLSMLVAGKKPKYTWKFATLGQDTIKFISVLTVDLTGDILRNTDGELKFLWYMGGIMGDEEDYVTKMRIGQLQGAGISGTANAMVCPGVSVFELPFLFQDWGEVRYIREKMRPKLNKIAEKNGFKILWFIELDFEHFYSSKYPLKTPEEFKKSKVLSWHGPLEAEVLKALGASPIPVNVPEVVPSMRAGVVDAAVAPSIWWLASQLYTITKYINPVPIRFDPYFLVVSMKAWNSVPKGYTTTIENFFKKKYGPMIDKEIRPMSTNALKGMINYGCTEVKMTPEEVEVFKKRTRPIWDKMIGKEYPKSMLDEIIGHLKNYRKKKK
ncbi:MAG: TRAP transporter substrate-binding protein DctP [Spirochaetota bacterium]|nr:TRAP transporter substrate-binding protein DctP [Spirochaetota bacterium]